MTPAASTDDDPTGRMPDLDPHRFRIERVVHRGFSQAFVRPAPGGVPLVCVHGWPETKRIFWRVIQPLVEAGFDVIVPDLRGFGDSSVGEGFGDAATHALDVHSLVRDHLSVERVVLLGGDLGGPVIQDLALRHPEWVERMVLFNSPLPYLADRMGDLDTAAGYGPDAADYFIRQATDADGLAAELHTDDERERYIATFYTSRFWGHPGAFLDGTGRRRTAGPTVSFHASPFRDAAKLRASFRAYESAVDPAARAEPARFSANDHTQTMILFGPSDHVIYRSFDLMAARVFALHTGPFLLRDCGHFVPWEAPHALVSATVAFCSDLLAASRERLPDM